MGWFDHDEGRDARNDVYNYDGNIPQEHHEGKFSHELISGAAGFEAMKAYEDHLRKTGQPVSHSTMKELLAGFASAEVDKLAESKGMDWVDREKAKHHAKEQSYQYAEQRYGQNNTGYEYATGDDYGNNYQQNYNQSYNQNY